VIATAVAAGASLPARAEDSFELRVLASPGRTKLAEIVDLDGDGRSDLLSVAITGLPPAERSELRVHFQRDDGSLPDRPDWIGAMPAGVAVYDLAPLPDADAAGVLFVARDRITQLSLAGRSPHWREVSLAQFVSIAVAPDERGLDRLRIARSDLGPEPRWLVPGLGEAILLTPTGDIVARMDVGARANYFVPPRPGPLFNESEIELYFDVPRLHTGDVDGDGDVDLIASGRHELRVFLQRPDGGFPRRADRTLALGLMSEADHIGNSGSVRIDSRDLNGDGRVDLLVSQSAEGLFRARSETRFHLNRGGTWDLAAPDQSFRLSGGFSTGQLIDLDGDGRLEFIEVRIPLGVLELVEMLVTRSIDTKVSIRRRDGAEVGEVYAAKPWFERKLDIPFSFETSRPKGFIPTLDRDWNGDGYRDILGSAGGEGIEIHLGGPDHRYRTRAARQAFDSSGRIRFGDVDGDGLTDFLLYDHRRPDAPLRIGINRGLLPGTRAPRDLEAASP
jgi:hypothetical protein